MDFLDTLTGTALLILAGALVFVFLPTFPVPEIAKGAFGLERDQQEGLFELSRLCVDPELPKKSIISLLGSLVAVLGFKETKVRAIISYADSNHHTGTIYSSYHGLTDPKKDFYYDDAHHRSESCKHRYRAKCFGNTIVGLWDVGYLSKMDRAGNTPLLIYMTIWTITFIIQHSWFSESK